MKQGRTESLRATPQISKNMLALWAYRTMKIWFTSTCLLSSLNDKYRKNAWGVVANQFSHKMPNTLDPVIQAVLTLTEGEISAHNDSDTSEEDDEEQFEKKKRTKKNKNSFATSANSNMCRYCKKVPSKFRHLCEEMIEARKAREIKAKTAKTGKNLRFLRLDEEEMMKGRNNPIVRTCKENTNASIMVPLTIQSKSWHYSIWVQIDLFWS